MIPPAAAQRLVKRRRISEAVGLSLDQVDDSELMALLGSEQRLIIDITNLVLLAGE